jgi:hypothetical protein
VESNWARKNLKFLDFGIGFGSKRKIICSSYAIEIALIEI